MILFTAIKDEICSLFYHLEQRSHHLRFAPMAVREKNEIARVS